MAANLMRRLLLYLFFVAVALCRPCSAATEQWIEVRSAHFTVLTGAGEKQRRWIHTQGRDEPVRGL